MNSPLPPSDADSDDRVEEVYARAVRLAPGERAGFVETACGADARLRDEVMGLLQAHDEAGSFLQSDAPPSPALEAEFARLTPEKPGDAIGPYILREKVGEGGFGTVWVAEQEFPMRRRVALKIIKAGMDTREVIARFEQERQALALMDHPNIARVLDAGATPLGRPYFVMELVRGTRITDYCDQAQLSTAGRLRLVIAVCHAVQHAHQKGIIHRDLKPSNILVTLHDGVPVPKVIDFGVAKATQQQRLTDLTVYTRLEQMVGTPLYMSPEQAELSGLDVDTRSDIYSLGVLLYELLAGRTPFDPETLLQQGLDEIRRVVREVEPPSPSTFLSTLAADRRTDLARRRQTDGTRLAAQLRGDLDWIVMKALEKDRSRRYDTATSLAQDIERHLASEPVEARPPSRWYRFRRFARRNRIAFVAGGAVATALVAGLASTTWMFLKERQARERAVAAEREQSRLRQAAEAQEQAAASEAAKSRQVARFLKDMLKGVGPSVALGRDTALLREILAETEKRLADDLKEQPEVEAEMRGVIGNVYKALGEFTKAGPIIDQALAMTKATRGAESAEYASLLENKAAVLAEQGRLAEAETVQREVLALNQKLFGPEHPMVAISISNLALVMEDRGRLPEAEALHREGLALSRLLQGPEHLAVATSLNNLGSVLQGQDKHQEAEPVLREALAMKRKLLGDEHPDVAITLNNLANTVQGLGRLEESESLFRETLALQRRFLGDAHPNVASALNGLGLALHKLGRNAEAESMLEEAVDIEKKVRASAHPQTARVLGNLARIRAAQRRFGEAETGYREALAIYEKLPGPENPDVPSWRNRLSMVLEAQGKQAESEAVLTENLAAVRRVAAPGSPDPYVASALYALASSLAMHGKHPEAEPLLREALDLNRQLSPEETLEHVGLAGNLGWILASQQKFAEAEIHLREAHTSARRLLGETHPTVKQWHARLTGVLDQQEKWAALQALQQETLDAVRAQPQPDPLLLDRCLDWLGKSLHRQAKFAEAETVTRDLLASRQTRLGPDHELSRAAITRLIHIYEAWGKPEEAARWQKSLDSLAP